MGLAPAEERPRIQTFATVLLLATILALENLEGAASLWAVRLATLGFLVFLARALLGTSLGKRVRQLPRAVRWALGAAVAGLFVAGQVALLELVLVFIFGAGGWLSVELFDDVARGVSRPATRVRDPVLGGVAAFAATACVGAAANLAAFLLPDRMLAHKLAGGLMGLAWGSYIVLLLILGLAVLAAFGPGRARLAGRAGYLGTFGLLTAAFAGYLMFDALDTGSTANAARGLSSLAIGIAFVELVQILRESPDAVAARGRLSHEAMWDFFLAVAFAVLVLAGMLDVAGMGAAHAVAWMKVVTFLGFVAGVFTLPYARASARRRAAQAAA
ncbi:MAG TPA: hypothetical protein VFH47_08730, partial [Candidatus Thermoplasmatota archaeon]|nr:hypothetical protein [Candidatus Thermoplasmatota archaeon]